MYVKTVFGHLKFEVNMLIIVFSSSLFKSVIVCCNVLEFMFFSELPGITKKKYGQNFWFKFAFNFAICYTLTAVFS